MIIHSILKTSLFSSIVFSYFIFYIFILVDKPDFSEMSTNSKSFFSAVQDFHSNIRVNVEKY